MKKSLKKYGFIFVLPTFLAFIIGFVAPFFMGLGLSFFEFQTVTDATFVGIENYVKALQDPTFAHSFWYTTAFAIVTVILTNVLAFFVALALTQELRGKDAFRTVFFMPNLIGGIVLGYIWQLIFNGILENFDLALALDENISFWALVILTCWQQVGYMMIIYIAGLGTIPGSLKEAAEIDGATPIQRLIYVTIPNMMPSFTICTFLALTRGFKLFDQNLALTAGEPSQKSEMLALNIYNTFYGRVGWEGVGQAKAVIFFFLVVVIALGQLYITRSKEVQQ